MLWFCLKNEGNRVWKQIGSGEQLRPIRAPPRDVTGSSPTWVTKRIVARSRILRRPKEKGAVPGSNKFPLFTKRGSFNYFSYKFHSDLQCQGYVIANYPIPLSFSSTPGDRCTYTAFKAAQSAAPSPPEHRRRPPRSLRRDGAVYRQEWLRINWLLEPPYVPGCQWNGRPSLPCHFKSKCINGLCGPLIPNSSRRRHGG